MVLACWWSVSAAVGSLFLGRAAAMQGEHYYVLTSLLIVYAGQHAAFKVEIDESPSETPRALVGLWRPFS